MFVLGLDAPKARQVDSVKFRQMETESDGLMNLHLLVKESFNWSVRIKTPGANSKAGKRHAER